MLGGASDSVPTVIMPGAHWPCGAPPHAATGVWRMPSVSRAYAC